MRKRVKKKTTIEHENLILCEGEDEYYFLLWYLNSEERKRDSILFSTSVDVLNFGGNDELPNFLETISAIDGFSGVKNILIIRDAEDDVKAAGDKVKSALRNAGYLVPEKAGQWTTTGIPHVAYLLFPVLTSEPE